MTNKKEFHFNWIRIRDGIYKEGNWGKEIRRKIGRNFVAFILCTFTYINKYNPASKIDNFSKEQRFFNIF